MYDPLPLPRSLARAPFRVDAALGVGLTRGRLRSADLVVPHLGVRTTRAPVTLSERVDALLPLLAPDQAFSDATAAALRGIPLPRRLEDAPLHVTTHGADRRFRRPGVVSHRRRMPDGGIPVVSGRPVTAPIDTWVALGAVLDVDELVIAGDALVGPLRLALVADLVAAVEQSHRRTPGRARLASAVSAVRVGSRSPAETRTRLVLIRGGLPEPALNHHVMHAGGFVAMVDLAYPAARVAIEYDSDLHRTDPDAFRRDLRRSERIKDAGWWPIRCTAWDLGRDADAFVTRVSRAIV